MADGLVLEQREGPLGRALYSLAVSDLSELEHSLELSHEHFALLLAWDATGAKRENIARLASLLIERGLAYLCAWGPDCERVHDVFDLVYLDRSTEFRPDTVIMTTWHDDEPLEEALWYFVHAAYPDDFYADTCTTGIAVAVANEEWASKLHGWLSDLQSLRSAVGL